MQDVAIGSVASISTQMAVRPYETIMQRISHPHKNLTVKQTIEHVMKTRGIFGFWDVPMGIVVMQAAYGVARHS